MCVIGRDGNDTSWEATIDSMALFIAKNHSKAPQIYYHESGDLCEFVGSVDRAKMRSDFILVVKQQNDTKFDCDPEWGRQSFAILNFYPDKYARVDTPDEDLRFVAKIAFTSAESSKDPVPKWKNVTSSYRLLNVLRPHFMSPQSRIPDEYPFKAEREERMKRRTLKAVIALMGLTVCSLLVIMFLGSLARYNESKKLKEQEMEKKKKHEQQAEAPAVKKSGSKSGEEKSSKGKSEKSSKKSSEKQATKSGKSGKSEESKSAKSSKKDDEKQPLIDKSSKSEKQD